VHLTGTPAHTGGRLRRGPPLLGEDTDAVLEELLGLSRDDVEKLRTEGALS
jgi:crotonobetainyl-CoA:carnitine CoA-transferase CaiB-like acyl-CoA transferase